MKEHPDVIQFYCKDGYSGEAVTIEYSIPHDYNIYTFHRLCKRFAAVCGYGAKSIEEVFGESQYEEDM